MSLVNIPSSVDDMNYRYKMPRIKCKVEGSGNGIKTNFMNMAEVSRALKRLPEYTTKFFGCELCVQARYMPDEGKALLQGVHSETQLAAVIDKFIEMYVLCPKCELPEIDLFLDKKLVMGRCNACGKHETMNNNHRLAAYIQKNPPEGTTMGGAATKKAAKKKGKATDDATGTNSKAADTGDKKKVKKKVVKPTTSGEEKTDVDDKKKKKRVRKVKQSDAFDYKNQHVICSRMRSLVPEGVDKFLSELRAIQVTQSFKHKERLYIGLSAVYGQVEEDDDEGTGTPRSNSNKPKLSMSIDDFKSKIEFVEALCDSDAIEADETLEMLVEWLDVECDDETFASLPLIIKCLYDNDVVEDEEIIEFFKDNCANEKATIAVGPLIKWFEDAEEQSSSYESEDED